MVGFTAPWAAVVTEQAITRGHSARQVQGRVLGDDLSHKDLRFEMRVCQRSLVEGTRRYKGQPPDGPVNSPVSNP